MFSKWKQPPPPPPKLWIQKPAWVSLVVTIVVILVLGPVGAIYQGLTEEMKSMKTNDKEQKGAIIQNQLAIKEILTRQEILLKPPKELKMIETKPLTKSTAVKPKVVLTPAEFNTYMEMDGQRRAAYKQYLEATGKDVRGLP